ncbi:MAG: permease-like cell division protein FtsX [Steroidobacteraceae bacterium]
MNTRAYFGRHAQTMIGSLGRIVRQPFASLMTMAVVAVALALPLFLNLLLTNVRTATGNWNDAFDLSVYMDKRASSNRVTAVAKQLRMRGDVAAVRIVTADQAMAEFRVESGFGTALDALGENPLPDTLIVTPTTTASSPRGTDALKEAIVAMADVQAVQIDTEWVKRVHAMLEILQRVVALTAALLGAGVVLIVGNTIRLDILNRRTEIEVMKLVGASDAFARRPFLYSGVWYGFGGGLLALIFVFAAAAVLARPVGALATRYGSPFQLQGMQWRTVALALAVAVALAWCGSWFAATRHIKAIDPT